MHHQPLPIRQQVTRITKVPLLHPAQDSILCLMRRQWAVISVASQRIFLERPQDKDNNPLHPVL
jgi:hypothetical protein